MSVTFKQHGEHSLTINGPIGKLQAITAWPDHSACGTVAVLCHPHPLYQGSMLNKVVTTMHKACMEVGVATVRFNYRGVGESDGTYGDIDGELDDCQAVIDWVKQQLPHFKLALAGFSFGSYIAADRAQANHTEWLISVGPPVERMPFNTLTNMQCPWLVVQGDDDEVISAPATYEWAAHPPSPLELIRMPATSHFFHGKLLELREHLVRWLAKLP